MNDAVFWQLIDQIDRSQLLEETEDDGAIAPLVKRGAIQPNGRNGELPAEAGGDDGETADEFPQPDDAKAGSPDSEIALMSVHNIVSFPMRCPRCARESTFEIEGFVGRGELRTYRVGDTIQWVSRKAPQHGGRPPDGGVDAEGYAVCEHCKKDFFVVLRVRRDTLVEVAPNPAKPGYIT